MQTLEARLVAAAKEQRGAPQPPPHPPPPELPPAAPAPAAGELRPSLCAAGD
eukprot:gene48558-61004_t